jgi:hypothetical protein
MPPPARKGSGEKQTKYESDTPPHGLRFANKASRIFRFPVEPVNIITKSSGCSRPDASNGDWRTIRRTNGEGIGDWPNRRAPPFKGKPQSRPPCGIRKHHHQIAGLLSLPLASNRDSRTIRRTNGEGIGDWPNRRAPPFKGKPQSPLSRGPIRSWLTRRSRRRSPSGPERGSCEQIGAARLWPSVAVPTRTSAMEAETASSKTGPGP